MTTLFWMCILLGGGIVVLQLGASLVGLHHDAPHGTIGHGTNGHGPVSEGLQLFSVRALSAGVAFFGVGGLAGLRLGVPVLAAVALAVVAAAISATGVAAVMRSMHRLEGDQSFRLANAVGLSGEVYLGIPARRSGTGKIHLTVQERLVELDAMTSEDGIATGTRVLVVDAIAPATVMVVLQPRILEDGDGDA